MDTKNISNQDQSSSVVNKIRYANFWDKNTVWGIDALIIFAVISLANNFSDLIKPLLEIVRGTAYTGVLNIHNGASIYDIVILIISIILIYIVITELNPGLTMTGLIKGADKKIIYKDADKEIKTRVKILGLSTQI